MRRAEFCRRRRRSLVVRARAFRSRVLNLAETGSMGLSREYFRQEDQASSDIPDRIPYRVSLVGAEIVRDRHWPLTSASSGGPSTPECRSRSCSS
jgi:hypothetical protein